MNRHILRLPMCFSLRGMWLTIPKLWLVIGDFQSGIAPLLDKNHTWYHIYIYNYRIWCSFIYKIIDYIYNVNIYIYISLYISMNWLVRFDVCPMFVSKMGWRPPNRRFCWGETTNRWNMFGFPWERSGSKLFLFWMKAGMRTNGMTLTKIYV